MYHCTAKACLLAAIASTTAAWPAGPLANHDRHIQRDDNTTGSYVKTIPSMPSNDTDSSNGTWPWQIFKTEPYNPPVFEINTTGEELAPGFIFIAPAGVESPTASKESRPIIMTDKGQLVWNNPTQPANASYGYTEFRVQSLNGLDYITSWYGYESQGLNIGHGYGNVTFLNSAYEQEFVICPQLGLVTPPGTDHQCEADLHEAQVTPWGTLLITAYNATPADLSAFGGPVEGFIFDCLVVEVEISTSKPLWTWSAADHVPLNHSQQLPIQNGSGTFDAPWDWFHINAIDPVSENSILVNSRNTWETYLVSKPSGEIQWTLNGETGGDFGPLPDNGRFRWQHHARVRNASDTSFSYSMFNDFNTAGPDGTTGPGPSTALELQLSLPPNKSNSPVVLEDLSVPTEPLYAGSQGSYQFLDDGVSQFVDYGQIAVLREWGPTPSGFDFKWEARFGGDNLVLSYRGFKQQWSGKPNTKPKLVISNGNAYVSWNGATEVTAWDVYAGDSGNQLTNVGRAAYAGFETTFAVQGQCVQVVAVGVEGGSSNVVCGSS